MTIVKQLFPVKNHSMVTRDQLEKKKTKVIRALGLYRFELAGVLRHVRDCIVDRKPLPMVLQATMISYVSCLHKMNLYETRQSLFHHINHWNYYFGLRNGRDAPSITAAVCGAQRETSTRPGTPFPFTLDGPCLADEIVLLQNSRVGNAIATLGESESDQEG